MRLMGLGLGLGLVLAQAAVAATFTDQQRAFSFDVPEGFQRVEEDNATRHAFFREVEPDLEAQLFLILSDKQMPQDLVVDRAVTESAMRKGAEQSGTHDLVFQYRQVRWREFKLEVAIAHSAENGRVSFSTRVPLASGMASVLVQGPSNEETRLSAEFDGVIASLKGETNWLTEMGRAEQLGFYVGLAIVPVTGLFVVAGILFKRRKR